MFQLRGEISEGWRDGASWLNRGRLCLVLMTSAWVSAFRKVPGVRAWGGGGYCVHSGGQSRGRFPKPSLVDTTATPQPVYHLTVPPRPPPDGVPSLHAVVSGRGPDVRTDGRVKTPYLTRIVSERSSPKEENVQNKPPCRGGGGWWEGGGAPSWP